MDWFRRVSPSGIRKSASAARLQARTRPYEEAAACAFPFSTKGLTGSDPYDILMIFSIRLSSRKHPILRRLRCPPYTKSSRAK